MAQQQNLYTQWQTQQPVSKQAAQELGQKSTLVHIYHHFYILLKRLNASRNHNLHSQHNPSEGITSSVELKIARQGEEISRDDSCGSQDSASSTLCSRGSRNAGVGVSFHEDMARKRPAEGWVLSTVQEN